MGRGGLSTNLIIIVVIRLISAALVLCLSLAALGLRDISFADRPQRRRGTTIGPGRAEAFARIPGRGGE